MASFRTASLRMLHQRDAAERQSRKARWLADLNPIEMAFSKLRRSYESEPPEALILFAQALGDINALSSRLPNAGTFSKPQDLRQNRCHTL